MMFGNFRTWHKIVFLCNHVSDEKTFNIIIMHTFQRTFLASLIKYTIHFFHFARKLIFGSFIIWHKMGFLGNHMSDGNFSMNKKVICQCKYLVSFKKNQENIFSLIRKIHMLTFQKFCKYQLTS